MNQLKEAMATELERCVVCGAKIEEGQKIWKSESGDVACELKEFLIHLSNVEKNNSKMEK